ncbi:hypothetical protein ACN9M0_09745 [Streptomyces sp. R-07]|uniref:hypothetical protein n=1 Tax=Streptomyces sp. R-07 TaxID=3404052 RepID=UPI003CEDD48E
MSAHQLPATSLSGAFAVTAAAAWAAAGRRRGTSTIAGALLVFQGALHLFFSTVGHSTAPYTQGMHHAMPGMDGMDGMDNMPGMDGMAMGIADPATTAPSMGTGSGVGMLAVHLLAALLCGLWLAHGEAAFFALARAALAYAFTPLRLLRALVPVPQTPRRPVRRVRRNARRPHAVVLAHTLSRRGPPRLSVPRATALGAHV